MPNTILVSYATRYGSTQEVAEKIAATLRERRLTVDAKPLKEVKSLDGYSAVVIGAPLHMFHWHKDALGFLTRFRPALEKLPVALFALGPVKEPRDEAEWQSSREQLDKELAPFAWLKPISLQMFGGKFDPARIGLLKMFAGKTPATDIRDWAGIRAWADELAVSFAASRKPG